MTLVPELELENLQLIKRLLQTTKYYTIFPYMAVAEELRQGLLACVPFKPALKRHVYLAAPSDRPALANHPLPCPAPFELFARFPILVGLILGEFLPRWADCQSLPKSTTA